MACTRLSLAPSGACAKTAHRPSIHHGIGSLCRAPGDSHTCFESRCKRVVFCRDSETKTATSVEQQMKTLDDRVRMIYDKSELDEALETAGDRLVVLELMNDDMCETGLFEAEDHWTPADEKHEMQMQECKGLRHNFVALAASSLSARFLSIMESEDCRSDVSQWLGITTFPAVVFFRNKQEVWRTQGSAGMKGDLAEGVLYFGGRHYVSSPSVAELGSQQDLDAYLAAESNATLKMVMTGTHMCSPCIHVYPSFVTLAANFSEQVDFARLEGDEDDMQPVFERLNVVEVPTFLVYKDGKEISRLVSSRRGDIIGFLLNLSMQYGIQPPKPK